MILGCKYCIYYEDCSSVVGCSHFAPATEEAEDMIYEAEQAEQRLAYEKAYLEYISGWN